MNKATIIDQSGSPGVMARRLQESWKILKSWTDQGRRRPRQPMVWLWVNLCYRYETNGNQRLWPWYVFWVTETANVGYYYNIYIYILVYISNTYLATITFSWYFWGYPVLTHTLIIRGWDGCSPNKIRGSGNTILISCQRCMLSWVTLDYRWLSYAHHRFIFGDKSVFIHQTTRSLLWSFANIVFNC